VHEFSLLSRIGNFNAEKDKSPAQLKDFLVILKILHVAYLDYLRGFIKANKLPHSMCGASRFFTIPLPISPICCGDVAGSDCLYIEWTVAGRGYGKKYTTRTIRIN